MMLCHAMFGLPFVEGVMKDGWLPGNLGTTLAKMGRLAPRLQVEPGDCQQFQAQAPAGISVP